MKEEEEVILLNHACALHWGLKDFVHENDGLGEGGGGGGNDHTDAFLKVFAFFLTKTKQNIFDHTSIFVLF